MLMSGSGTAGGLVVTAALNAYTAVWTAVAGFVSNNPPLLIFLLGGIITMVWKHFKRAKKSVR